MSDDVAWTQLALPDINPQRTTENNTMKMETDDSDPYHRISNEANYHDNYDRFVVFFEAADEDEAGERYEELRQALNAVDVGFPFLLHDPALVDLEPEGLGLFDERD